MNRRRAVKARLVIAVALLAAIIPAGSASAYQSPNWHWHQGWVKYTVLEQFGVTSTEVYVKGQYYQQNNLVGGMFLAGGSYCYHSAFPWELAQCYYYLTNNEPSSARIDIVGEFHHFPTIDYQQHAYFKASSNNGWTKGCYFDHGALPYSWRTECTGTRSQ